MASGSKTSALEKSYTELTYFPCRGAEISPANGYKTYIVTGVFGTSCACTRTDADIPPGRS
jgi:hypothetical protein